MIMSYNRNTHIKFFNKYKEKYHNDLNFKKTEDDIIRLMDKYIKPKMIRRLALTKYFDILSDNFISGYIKPKKIDRLRNEILRHTIRVVEHKNIILEFGTKQGRQYDKCDRYITNVNCMLHDIGKLYKDDENHAIYSYIMVKYLIDNDDNPVHKNHYNDILEPILMHGNKEKYKNKIIEYTAILRDADVFDENCGHSLVRMLYETIMWRNIDDDILKYAEPSYKWLDKINLNKENFSVSDGLMSMKNSPEYITKIKNKINIPWDKSLYDIERHHAIDKYLKTKYDYLEKKEDCINDDEYADIFEIDID